MSVAALIGVAPTLLGPWGLNPFLPVKVATTWLALGLLAALVGVRRPELPRWALVAGGLLLAWLGAAALSSDAPVTSLLGAPTRLLGWATWVGFACALCVGAAVGQRAGRRDALVVVARAAAVPVAVGALLVVAELAGRPLVSTSLEFEGRALGLFGNPALTAAHLVLFVPLSLVAARSDVGRWPVVHRAVVGLALGTILATGSRAAMVAVVVAGALTLLDQRLRADRGRSGGGRSGGRSAPLIGRRLAGAAGAILVVAVLGVLATGRWSGAGATLGGRVDTWAIAATVVADAPLLGVGPEGFGAAFAVSVDEDFVVRHTRDQVTDRAHDVFLDVAVAGGLPAVVSFVMLLCGVAVALWRRRDEPLVAAAGLGVAAVLLQQLVLFPQPVHDTLLWFVVGVAVAADRSGGRTDRRQGARALTGRVLVGVACLVLVAVGGLAVVADAIDASAYRVAPAPGATVAARSVSLHPVGEQHALVVADRALASNDVDTMRAAGLVVAEAQSRAFDTGLLTLARVDLLQRVHQRRPDGDADALTAARDLLADLLQRDPTNGEAHLKLGVVAFEQGHRAEAVRAWERAEVLLPGRTEPRQNLDLVDAP